MKSWSHDTNTEPVYCFSYNEWLKCRFIKFMRFPMHTFICKYGFFVLHDTSIIMCTLTVLRMSLTLQCCFSMSTSWLLLNEDIQWSVHEMFLYPAEQNKTRNQVLLDDAPVNCSVVLLDPFFTYFIICTYPCWAGGWSLLKSRAWGLRVSYTDCKMSWGILICDFWPYKSNGLD